MIQINNKFLASVYLTDNRTGQIYLTKKGARYAKFSISLGKTSGFLSCVSFSETVVKALEPFAGQQSMRGITITMGGELQIKPSQNNPQVPYIQFVADNVEIFTYSPTQSNGDKYTSVRGVAKTPQQIIENKIEKANVSQSEIEDNLDTEMEEVEIFWDTPTQVMNTPETEMPISNDALPMDDIAICIMCHKNFVQLYDDQKICNLCSKNPVAEPTPLDEVNNAHISIDSFNEEENENGEEVKRYE